MDKILKKLSSIGIIPVVTIDDIEKAIPLAEALVDGGIHCVEITFRTEQAEESIKRITTKVPKMLVGAGTILNTEQADKAINAGAKFLISPGLNPKVVEYCIEKKYFLIPGIATPSDIERAINVGVDTSIFNMLGFEIDHIGINTKNSVEANELTESFSKLFNFSIYENDFSIFMDKSIEIIKSLYLGKYGHIAIKTNYIERAINYIEAMGGKFDISTLKEENGHIKSIFLKEEIGGYAIQIVQK